MQAQEESSLPLSEKHGCQVTRSMRPYPNTMIYGLKLHPTI
jgi:hypothetical protein